MSNYTRSRKKGPSDSTPLHSTTGQIVARLHTDADGLKFILKSIDGERHILRKPPALCIDLQVLSQGKAEGADYIKVRDRNTGEEWTSTIKNFEENGFSVSRRCGPQWAMSFPFWSSSKLKLEVTELPITITQPKVVQFDLYAQEEAA